MSDQAEELVTVAAAARALGCDPRQVRRYAARLSDTDRTQDNGVLRVRLSAVRAQRAQRERAPARGRQETDRTRTGTGHRTQAVLSDVSEALQADVAFLRAQLEEKDRQLAQAAKDRADLLAVVGNLTAHSNRLLEENRALRALPAGPAGKDSGQDTAEVSASEPSGGPDTRGGFVIRPERRRWWPPWGRRG